MKDNRRTPSLIALLGTCTLALPLTLGVSVAHAMDLASTGGSATYRCKDNHDPQATATPVTFDLISPPAEVRPGDTLALSGNVSITLSATDLQKSRLMLANKASINATDFDLVVAYGDKKIDIKPISVISTAATIQSPWTVVADLSYPDVDIPASAKGSITITMPLAEDTNTKVTGAPTKVTFTADVKQNSLLVASRTYACWADKLNDKATVARIPLSKTSPTGSSTSTGSPSGGSTSAGSAPSGGTGAGAPVPAAPLGGASLPSEAPPSADTPAEAPPAEASAAATATSAPIAALVNAPIPNSTVSHETFVPGWVLALFIALFPAAAVTYAAVLRKRLHRRTAQTIQTATGP